MNGLRSIPRKHQGEHLAYISPQEAQMLRRQGGGVAPDGGQLQGPGGIPSFQNGPGGGNPLDMQQIQKNQRLFESVLGNDYDDIRHLNQSRGYNVLGGLGNPNFSDAVFEERFRLDASRQDEEAPTEERDTSELEAEIAALTAGAQQRGADRMAAMYANLGWGTPPPQFGSATEGGDQFFTEQVTADQVPAYANIRTHPAVYQALGAPPGTTVPIPTQRKNLRQVVQERAGEIRGNAKGGMINRYDLGGLVNNMLLQAGRTRDNIPTNAVS